MWLGSRVVGTHPPSPRVPGTRPGVLTGAAVMAYCPGHMQSEAGAEPPHRRKKWSLHVSYAFEAWKHDIVHDLALDRTSWQQVEPTMLPGACYQ